MSLRKIQMSKKEDEVAAVLKAAKDEYRRLRKFNIAVAVVLTVNVVLLVLNLL